MAFCKNFSPLISQPTTQEYVYKYNNPCGPINLEVFNLKIVPKTVQMKSHVIHSQGKRRRIGLKRVECNGEESKVGPPADDRRCVETVLKLFEAIKNRNISEVSDMIAEECLFISNFVSAFQPLRGKKQILDFLSSWMNKLGNNIEFKVHPMSDDGMVVVVSWKLEWKDIPIPLGKGFSIYVFHIYQGKVMIKNMEMFIEPVLHIEPLRMKTIAWVMTVMEKLNSNNLLKGKAGGVYNILFALFYILALVIFIYSWCAKKIK